MDVLERLTDQELINISNELNQEFIPEDGLSRIVASELLNKDVSQVNLVDLIGIGIPVLKEMTLRFKIYSSHVNKFNNKKIN